MFGFRLISLDRITSVTSVMYVVHVCKLLGHIQTYKVDDIAKIIKQIIAYVLHTTIQDYLR